MIVEEEKFDLSKYDVYIQDIISAIYSDVTEREIQRRKNHEIPLSCSISDMRYLLLRMADDVATNLKETMKNAIDNIDDNLLTRFKNVGLNR